MSELIAANWWLIVLAVVVGLAVAWWIFIGGRRTRVDLDKRDTLDEGADRARRNQALIDAPAKPEAILASPPPPAAPPPAAKASEPVRAAKPKPVPPPPPPAKKAAPKPAPKKAAPVAEKTKPAAKKPAAKTPAAPKPAAPKAAAPKTAAKKPAAKKPAARKPTPPPVAETVELPPPVPEGLAGVGVAVQAEAAPAPAPHHDLALLKGVGPKLVAMLHQVGVTGFDDIAGWSEADIDRIDAQLEQFQGRIRRDNWVDQAKLLAAGDIVGFEAKYGKI